MFYYTRKNQLLLDLIPRERVNNFFCLTQFARGKEKVKIHTHTDNTTMNNLLKKLNFNVGMDGWKILQKSNSPSIIKTIEEYEKSGINTKNLAKIFIYTELDFEKLKLEKH